MLAFIGLALLLANASLQAQVCNPDPSLTAPGIYPDTLLPVCSGIPYSEVITFIVPVDTQVVVPPFGTFTIPIDSITLDNVFNLPPGMTYACSPVSCSFPGNSSNCILFSGTPLAPGTYEIEVAVTAYITVLGSPVANPDTISLYTFTVFPGISDTLATVDDCGLGVGSVAVSTLGTSPFTYLWSNSQTSASISGLMAGAYSLILTDGNGCADTLETVVGNTGAPVLTLDSTGFVGCFGDEGGFVNLSTTGGMQPYVFSWSNGATSEQLSGVPGGSYVLTATDVRGCSVMETFPISAPAELVVALDGTDDVSCFGLDDGIAEVTATGGIGTAMYMWNASPAQTGRVATDLTAGSYTVIATDVNGCADTLEVVITSPDTLALSLAATDESLAGAADGTATVQATGGTGTVSFVWSNGETSAMIDSLAPGTYTVAATDENGCTTLDSVIIEMGPVSIGENLPGNFASIRVFPNPTQGLFTLQVSLLERDEPTVSLLDLTGRVLEVRQVAATEHYEASWDVRAYPAGSYLLQVRGRRGVAVQRLIVMP